MITINVYKNGYEIIGHAKEKICHQVSLWHWISSNLILGLDKDAREYTSHADNPNNLNEGLSWVICNPQMGNLEWILEDLVVSANLWGEKYWEKQVSIERIDDILTNC